MDHPVLLIILASSATWSWWICDILCMSLQRTAARRTHKMFAQRSDNYDMLSCYVAGNITLRSTNGISLGDQTEKW